MLPSVFLLCFTLVPHVIRSQPAFTSFNQYNNPSIVNSYYQQNMNHGNQSKEAPSNVQANEGDSASSVTPTASSFNERYLVGNLSKSFTFQVAPPSVKVTYLGLNGLSLYIMGVGFSNKTKFNYDEQNNRLTILSLDKTTVGHYSAVDNNWKTFTTVLTAINVSSLQIENFRVREENRRQSSVSCSVSIIRSTYKEVDQSSSLPSGASGRANGLENMARLNLFLSTRLFSPSVSSMSDEKLYNDSSNGQILIRSISMKHELTRADHNGTIQCQVESNNNVDVYLTRTEFVDIFYGPNLEAGATQMVTLKSETMKMISMECQIEANPSPSYVWYELSTNQSTGFLSNVMDQPVGSSTSSQSVFGTARQIQRMYQHAGTYSMQCQAQANGKTVRQDFVITVESQSSMRIPSDLTRLEQKTSNIPMVIGIVVGVIFLILVVAIVVALLIHLRRRKGDPETKDSIADKTSTDKTTKSRWGNLPIDYGKYKADSSSTSHLVESTDNGSIQVPSTGNRSSPVNNSQHSSYRQTPSTLVSLSYRQASALPGFRPLTSNTCYSVEQDEADEVSNSIVIRPSTINRSRATTPLGSHRSLSASIQSLRSNQQAAVILPMKKRSQEQPKQEDLVTNQHDYQHHHYQNPEQLENETISTVNEEQQTKRTFSSNYADPSRISHSIRSQVDSTTTRENHYAASFVSDRTSSMRNQTKEKHHDEVPPSYQQVSNPSTSQNSYVYHEPTEV